MNKYIKKMISMVVTVCTVFSLSFVSADSPWRGVDQYRKYVDKQQKPRTLILGSGRGELSYVGAEYADKIYKDKQHDYFLVDRLLSFKPDYACDATNQAGMDMLGPCTWDKCILEFLPWRATMNGALRNALRLVKSGGKVYMNLNCSSDDNIPEPMLGFQKSLEKSNSLCEKVMGLFFFGSKKSFYEQLVGLSYSKRVEFFNQVYGLSAEDISDIKVVSPSDEVWPRGFKDEPDLRIWEITKA